MAQTEMMVGLEDQTVAETLEDQTVPTDYLSSREIADILEGASYPDAVALIKAISEHSGYSSVGLPANLAREWREKARRARVDTALRTLRDESVNLLGDDEDGYPGSFDTEKFSDALHTLEAAFGYRHSQIADGLKEMYARP